MNDTINRQIHEAMGKCWHEWKELPYFELHGGMECKHCGSPDRDEGVFPSRQITNPDYCSSLTDAFDLVEWMRKEKGTEFVIKTARAKHWNVYVNGIWEHHDDLPRAISLAAIKALEEK